MLQTSESSELIYELQSEGHKLTKLREAVIDIFTRHSQPLLLKDLNKLLKKYAISVHRVTLYRELDFLEYKKIIEKVTLPDGKVRYEFADRGHHHHAVCTKCKKIEDVEIEDDAKYLEDKVVKAKDFKITRHVLEFFGVCGDCQKV